MRHRLVAFVFLSCCFGTQAAAQTTRVLVLGAMPQAMLARRSMSVEHRLETIDGFIATVDSAALPELQRQPGVVGVAVDRVGRAALGRSVPQTHADRVQRRDDLGAGVTVAVLDDGIEASHPDLAGRVDAQECFCAPHCCPNGTDRQSGAGAAQPQTDHGTHVAGIIGSAGLVAPTGVAPQARFVAVKVLDDMGLGLFSDWLRALDWIAAHRPEVRVVNMSLESTLTFDGHCDGGPSADFFNLAIGRVIDMLRARGTITFAAAGNAGDPHRLSSPGCISGVVAVGGLRRDDVPANYSNSGPALDLLAPGGNQGTGGGILSCALHGGTTRLLGTSMATAHASGAAALLLSIAPSLGANDVEQILSSSGKSVVDERNDLTRPRIDALAAYQAALDTTRPLTGGGSRSTDCLLEWGLTPDGSTRRRPIPGTECHDNDPVCDGDHIAGQCTIGVAACVLRGDARLPRCSTNSTLQSLRGSTVSTDENLDRVNQAALDSALSPTPAPGTCSPVAPILVPAGNTVWLRSRAVAVDGRADNDRLRLRCIP